MLGLATSPVVSSSHSCLWCARTALLSAQFTMHSNLAERAGVVSNLNGGMPHESLYPASSGVVLAAVNECQFHTKVSLARFKSPNGNTQRQLEVLQGSTYNFVSTDGARFCFRLQPELMSATFNRNPVTLRRGGIEMVTRGQLDLCHQRRIPARAQGLRRKLDLFRIRAAFSCL